MQLISEEMAREICDLCNISLPVRGQVLVRHESIHKWLTKIPSSLDDARRMMQGEAHNFTWALIDMIAPSPATNYA